MDFTYPTCDVPKELFMKSRQVFQLLFQRKAPDIIKVASQKWSLVYRYGPLDDRFTLF